MESASTTSGPPPASSLATPPEFYLDENAVKRAVRRRLEELGYTVHTPAQLMEAGKPRSARKTRTGFLVSALTDGP